MAGENVAYLAASAGDNYAHGGSLHAGIAVDAGGASCRVLPPCLRGRFRDLFDEGVSFAQKRLHVAAEDEGFSDAAKQRDRRRKTENVAHLALSVGENPEVVVVLHGAKGAAQHGVLKICWWIEGGNPRGETLADEEVAGAPGDSVAEREQAGGRAFQSDSLLAEVGV